MLTFVLTFVLTSDMIVLSNHKEMRKMRATLSTEQKAELTQLLADVWRNDSKMIDHCMKSSKYIYLNGKYINCCDAKPAIKKTMWYDDEQENPGKGFDRFVDYNFTNVRNVLGDNKTYYFGKNYYRQTGNNLVNIRSFEHWQEPDKDLTPMTEAEKVKINEAITEVRADFMKRLKTYYKKYNDKIRSSGYWVNR